MFDSKNIYIDGYKCEVRINVHFKPSFVIRNTLYQNKEYEMIIKTKVNDVKVESRYYKEKFLEEEINEEELEMIFKESVKRLREKINDSIKEKREKAIWDEIDLEALL